MSCLSYFVPTGCMGYDVMTSYRFKKLFPNDGLTKHLPVRRTGHQLVLIDILSYVQTTFMRSDLDMTLISLRGSTCRIDIKFEVNLGKPATNIHKYQGVKNSLGGSCKSYLMWVKSHLEYNYLFHLASCKFPKCWAKNWL